MDTRTLLKKNRRIFIALAFFGVLSLGIAAALSGDSVGGLLRLLRTGDEHAIAAYLEQEGIWQGGLSVILLSVVQIISIFLPGFILQVAVGVIFVWWKAFLLSFAGFLSGHLLVFATIRFFLGKEYFSEEAVRQRKERRESILPKRLEDSWLAEKIQTASPVIVVMLACIMPGMANGFIPHVAARTQISTAKFAAAIALSGWLQILCNSLAGHFLIREDYFYSVITVVIQIAVMLVVVRRSDAILKHFDRIS
ncbi:MAG: VTT domain-containing protein [Lachnospiraceae bacterium]|nr:VTT domain-containing protein [Lachnospiraceae bacterium]